MPRYNAKFFDAAYYINANKDVAANWSGDVQEHFALYGAKEGRLPSSWFDFQYIRSTYSDLAGMTNEQLFTHYNNYGFNEGRVTAATYANFDAAKYLATYADLGSAGITAASALSHYLAFGAAESRTALNKDGSAISGNGTAVNVGSTFTLTTGADNVVGTAGNDTLSGNVDTIANGGTLNNADVVNGGAGTDTLNISVAANASWPAGAVISNVEVFNLRDVDGGAANLSFAGVAGATTISNKGSTANVAVTDVQNAVTIGMNSSVKDLSVTYAANKLASTTATQALSLNGAGDVAGAAPAKLTLAVAGADVITKMTVNSSTAASTVKISGGAFTDLTVTGDAAVTLAENAAGTEFNALKTIDASAMTAGGLTVDLKSQAGNLTTSFKGGAGNDAITLNSAHLTSADTITGGAGTDTLGLDVAGAASSIAAAASLLATGTATGVTGFEAVKLSAANKVIKTAITATFDESLIAGSTKVIVASDFGAAADSVLAISNTSSGDTINFTAAQTGVTNVTFKPSLIGTGDLSSTIAFNTKATDAGIAVAAIVESQTNILTINSLGSSINTIGTLTAANNTSLKTINVTGSDELKITGTLDVKALTKLDASGLVLATTTAKGLTMGAATTDTAAVAGTSGVTYIGSNGVDTILGGTKGDTITGGVGADVITLGTAGKTDTVIFTSAADSTATAKDAVTVFEGARDVLKFTGFTVAGTFSVQTATFTGAGNASAVYASAADMTGAGDLKMDFNGDGVADMTIALTGTGTLANANFVFA